MMKREDYNYFNEFIKHAQIIVDSTIILKNAIENFENIKIDEEIEKLHLLENEADKNLHNMKNYLLRDFLPPIEREDITELINWLDNVEDDIDEILINFNILDISEMRNDVLEFTELLNKCAICIKEMCEHFKNIKKRDLIKEKVIEVNKIEEMGDRIFEKNMKNLYAGSSDPIEIIKWTKIYNCFENTLDECEKLADSLDDVVMKNS